MIVIYVKPIVVVCFVIGKYNPPESYGDFDTSEKISPLLTIECKDTSNYQDFVVWTFVCEH
jgi:hypothetical protein